MKISAVFSRTTSQWAFIFLCLFCASAYNLFRSYFSPTPFVHDVDQYYSYLNALFIHGDLGFQFEGAEQYWLMPTPSGNPVPKVTFGLAMLYLPWFLLAMIISSISGAPINAYSEIFAWSSYYGSIIYVLIGLWFLRKSLLNFFSEKAVAFTLVSTLLATNLLFYTLGWNLMSHGYLFFLYSILIWQCIKWNINKDFKSLSAIALLIGISILIRPTECIIVLVPLLWGVANFKDFLTKLNLIFSYRLKLIFPVFLLVLPFLLQMLYWKTYAGTWLFFSYGEEERFFWSQPEILNVLLSFRNGLIPYSLVLIFLVPGLIVLFNKYRPLFYVVLVTFSIALYVISSWWCWWFGGSFGMRALVQYYPLLAIPLAAFFELVLNKSRIVTILICTFVLFFVSHTISNAMLFKGGILHWDSMTRKAYFYLQFKHKFSSQEMELYQKMLKTPDYETAHYKRNGEKWYE